MFLLISWPHCVLVPILHNSQYYRGLFKHEKGTGPRPGHMGSHPGCAANSCDLGHLGQPFCASDPVRWRWWNLFTSQPGWEKNVCQTNMDIVTADSETTVAYMFHFIYVISVSKQGSTLCYDIFDHVLIHRFQFELSFLRAEVKALLQTLLSQSRPLPTFTIV